MPCGYHLNLEDSLITISGKADIDINRLQSVCEELLADPEFDQYLPQLIDLRGLKISRNQDSSAAFRQFILTTYRPKVQASIAIIVNENLDEATLAEFYHVSCALDKTELFDVYDQALKWLMRQEFAWSDPVAGTLRSLQQ